MLLIAKDFFMKESLFRTLKFTKGYLYGFAAIWMVPRTWFDQIAMTYYDIMEPEEAAPEPKNTEAQKI